MSTPLSRFARTVAAQAALKLALSALLASATPGPVYAEEAASPQRNETAQRPNWDGVFHLGILTLDPEVRFDSEWRRTAPPSGTRAHQDLGVVDKRVGIEGRLGKRLGFELSAELTASMPWRTARADYRLPGGVKVTGGQFKVPFSLDGTRSASERDFVFRSRLADAFTMGRDRGVTAEMNLWRKRVAVEGGLFARDGDRVASDSTVPGGARNTRVVRVTVAPLSRTRNIFKDLRVGISGASSELDEGRSNLTLRTVAGKELTAPVYWSRGARRRTGIDLRWRPGPFSVSTEYLAIADERHGQGTADDDLAPVEGSGWYLEGTWLVTGETKAKTLRPARPLSRGGAGAIELVGRAEQAAIGKSGFTTALAGSPRATYPALSRARVFTVGTNWYPVAGARLQFNVTQETIAGATAKSLQAVTRVLTSAVRFQLFL